MDCSTKGGPQSRRQITQVKSAGRFDISSQIDCALLIFSLSSLRKKLLPHLQTNWRSRIMAIHRQRWSTETDWTKELEKLRVPQVQRDPNKAPLLGWNALPDWMRDNQYILRHYRPPSYSYNRSFQSLFYLNNESVNIHSHLLGASLFLFMSVSVYLFRQYPVSAADILAFGCFFTGAVLCLGMSALYHTISNHSPQVNRFANQLDYVGIVALITGSFIPSVYYGFYCERFLRKVYWGMVRLAYMISCSLESNSVLRS